MFLTQDVEKGVHVSQLSRSFTFPKDRRLTQASHFQYVYASKKRFENHLVRIYVAPCRDGIGKWGFITSKKLGKAVVRNRCRRQLKEIFRQHQHDIHSEFDMVIVAKAGLLNFTFQDIDASLFLMLRNRGYCQS